ncbi:hypothetical protein LuPra_05153 [Luteitalea pratensis]|uniref:Uncharacterized protein n=1 Tax=Luteitalea pratensis TaxID=1855912 RepID=A0A143PTB4_LUTPR|nr:hypothetical protein LuPra_05153 [Luteitalea pratensis]
MCLRLRFQLASGPNPLVSRGPSPRVLRPAAFLPWLQLSLA